MKTINLKCNHITFQLKPQSDITLVCGDSGTGKTLLYRLLRAKQQLEEIPNLLLYNLNDYQKFPLEEYIELKNISNHLIIVDNADMVLSPLTRQYIRVNSKNNIYVLFGRDPSNLSLLPSNIAELKRENNIIKLRYYE